MLGTVESNRELGKLAARSARGIPDRREFGDPTSLQAGGIQPYVVQQHFAAKAGPHFDVRIGGAPGKQMFSWAGRSLPSPGEKRLFVAQPLHAGQYRFFTGPIRRGYGKGRVERHDLGSVLITKVTPTNINFTIAHRGTPERFTLVKPTKGHLKHWLLVNTTPVKPIPYRKVRYVKVPAQQVEKLFDPDYLVSAKIDGAAALVKLFRDKIDVVSYRASKEGRPIIHTERLGVPRDLKLPPGMQDTVLRGEIYGERKGRAIPAAELGGLLNASIQHSLEKQRAKGTKLRTAVLDVQRFGGKEIPPEMPFTERRELVQRLLRHLPADSFHEPPYAASPEEARELWGKITGGRFPLTREGIVAQPLVPGKRLAKAKQYPEADVLIKKTFPGIGRLAGSASGGFWYALPRSPDVVVGKVGTGFSDEDRADMFRNPDRWIGRTARIRAQEQFPSGAYRAPAFLARHEDYPLAVK